MKKTYYLILAVVFLSACATTEKNLIGGDKDSHGCIGSAGYMWCDARQQCIRPWEEPCTGAKVINAVYLCGPGYGEIKVEFYGQEFASVETATGKFKLERAMSASGARYTGNNIMLWDKSGKAVLELYGNTCNCTVKE